VTSTTVAPSSRSCPTAAHVAARSRVEALRQLVEEHQLRPVEQRQHEKQPLPLAAAQRREGRVAALDQAEPVEQLAGVARSRSREQLDRLADPQPVRQRRVLQLAADQRAQPVGLGSRVVAEDAQYAAVRVAQPL